MRQVIDRSLTGLGNPVQSCKSCLRPLTSLPESQYARSQTKGRKTCFEGVCQVRESS